MTSDPVYRAPMRSRSDAIDHGAAVERALTLGLVGVGRLGAEHEQERLARRLERFAAVPDGAFVWTRDADDLPHLGRIAGPLRHDLEGGAHDLADVRPCEWRVAPTVPPGVAETFARGGRNFQQVHAPGVEDQTRQIWAALTS
jgi:hypothetical protein